MFVGRDEVGRCSVRIVAARDVDFVRGERWAVASPSANNKRVSTSTSGSVKRKKIEARDAVEWKLDRCSISKVL